MSPKKQKTNNRQRRNLRIRQILFSVIAIMIILVMVIGLFAKY